jgi:hypothetical protein
MREFWQGIRNKKPVAQIAYDLGKLSNLAIRTQDTYTTLLERFPNSKNMLNLQARYIAIVGSDRETAATFSEAAEINEENVEDDDVVPNDNNREVGKITVGPTAPSVGSSTTSTSKIAKLIKQRRDLLLERLNAPFRSIMKNSSVMLVVYLGLIVAASLMGYLVLKDVNNALTFFARNSSRTVTQWMLLYLRRMLYYANLNDRANFNTSLTKLTSQYVKWNSAVVPLFMDGYYSNFKTIVKVWETDHFLPKEMTALEVATFLQNCVGNTIQRSYTYFQNASIALRDPNLRFILDNTDDLRVYFTNIKLDEIEHYINTNKIKQDIMIICLGALLALIFAYGVVFTLITFKNFNKKYFIL